MTDLRAILERKFASASSSSDAFNVGDPYRFTSNPLRDHSDAFLFTSGNFMAQYSNLYFCRLNMMRPEIRQSISKTLPNIPITDITHVGVGNNPEEIIIGCIYKEMKMKPSALKEINVIQHLTSHRLEKPKYTSQDDYLYIEDENGRLLLDFSQYDVPIMLPSISSSTRLRSMTKPEHLITGMVLALQGRSNKHSIFFVQAIHMPEMAPQNIRPNAILYKVLNENNPIRQFYETRETSMETLTSAIEKEDSNFIMFVSGLKISHEQNNMAHLAFLVTFLKGILPTTLHRRLAKKISRVVFAGNNIYEHADVNLGLLGSFRMNEQFNKMYKSLEESHKALDNYISEVAQFLDVLIMPGMLDASDGFFPQSKIHELTLPKSFASKRVTGVTNPCEFEIGNMLFLGSSGENVTNLKKFCNYSENPMDIMEMLIWSRHIAPSCPDTLGYS